MLLTSGDLIRKYMCSCVRKDLGHTSFLTLLINTYAYVHVYVCIYICVCIEESCIHIYIASFLETAQCHPVPPTFKSSLWSEKY